MHGILLRNSLFYPHRGADPLVRLFVYSSRPTRGSAAGQGARPTYPFVVTATLLDFSPGEEAVTRIWPGLPVDCTMARHNPLNAFRRVDW